MALINTGMEPGPYEFYKADSGGIRFQVRFPNGNGEAKLALTAREFPRKDLYKFVIGQRCTFEDKTKKRDQVKKYFDLPVPLNEEYLEFWVTWYNNVIIMGMEGQMKTLFEYDEINITNDVGFVKFHTISTSWPVDWLFESSPVTLESVSEKQFEDGKLRWEKMRNSCLPPDAFIGGFEQEPIYIARAHHRGSVCPGKFVLSQNLAFIPWGHREHTKLDFQILCGYNAKWLKTNGDNIPLNAFIAGSSEVRNEPLYIGRAIHEGNLITGKVHALYKKCYLPYNGNEIEVSSFEILVSPDVIQRGESRNFEDVPHNMGLH